MPIRVVPKELQQKAERELNEDPTKISEYLLHIREWLAKQPHLTVRDDDQTLIGFLRGCKYSLERTKAKIDHFYTVRSMMPETFHNRDPLSPEVQEILNANIMVPLPKTADAAAPRVFMICLNNCNPETITTHALFKVFFMSMDILIKEDDNSIIAGMIHLSDFKNFPLIYATQLTPSVLKKYSICMHAMYPIRTRSSTFINVSNIFEKLYALIKPIIPEKIANRVVLCSGSNSDDINKIVPRDILPREYGGDFDSVADLAATWKKKVESYRGWFLEEDKYGSNEKLRPEKIKTFADIFGVEGSFRKLNLD